MGDGLRVGQGQRYVFIHVVVLSDSSLKKAATVKTKAAASQVCFHEITFFFFVTAIQRMESEDDESIMGADNDGELGNEIDKAELNNVIKTLGSKLEDLQTCHDLIVKHGLALQRSLNELESSSARYVHIFNFYGKSTKNPMCAFFSAKIMKSTKLHPLVQETLDAILIPVMTIASKSKL